MDAELPKRGLDNPDARDAGAFLERAEGREPEGYPYFGDYYEDRIKMMRPDSRLGVFPYPPTSVSDAYGLAKSLREVYRLIILGEYVDPADLRPLKN